MLTINDIIQRWILNYKSLKNEHWAVKSIPTQYINNYVTHFC